MSTADTFEMVDHEIAMLLQPAVFQREVFELRDTVVARMRNKHRCTIVDHATVPWLASFLKRVPLDVSLNSEILSEMLAAGTLRTSLLTIMRDFLRESLDELIDAKDASVELDADVRIALDRDDAAGILNLRLWVRVRWVP